MIKVVNVKDFGNVDCWNKEKGVVYIRVDRSSVLGNPFKMNSEAQREAVIVKYKDYFRKEVKKEGDFRKEVIRLYKIAKKYDLYLGCWCSPKKCHAEVIKEFIESYL